MDKTKRYLLTYANDLDTNVVIIEARDWASALAYTEGFLAEEESLSSLAPLPSGEGLQVQVEDNLLEVDDLQTERVQDTQGD